METAARLVVGGDGAVTRAAQGSLSQGLPRVSDEVLVDAAKLVAAGVSVYRIDGNCGAGFASLDWLRDQGATKRTRASLTIDIT